MPVMALDARQIKKKRTGYLILSTAALLLLGLIYAFSMFARPMAQDFGMYGDINLTFSIMMITFCVGSVLGSFLGNRFGIRVAILASAFMFAIGFIGAGVLGADTGSVWALYIFYGAIGGFGVGIGYNTIIATTNIWFPEKVGFSSGVLMMGFGMGSLVFGNVALQLRLLLGGMGTVLVVLGVLVAVLMTVLAFVLKKPPDTIVEIMMPTGSIEQKALDCSEDGFIYKAPIFFPYYIWAIIILAIGLTIIGSCASDAMKVGAEESFASLLVGLVSTFNGLSRIVVGVLFDKTNIKVTMLVNALIASFATVLVVCAFALSSLAFYVVGALLCGFAYGSVPVIASAFARQRFGASKYPFNLSVLNFSVAFGSFVNIGVVAAVGQDARMTTFLVMMVLSFGAVASVFLFSKLWNKDMKKRKLGTLS